MSFKKILPLFFLLLVLFLPFAIFAQENNTGFVESNIWYSKDPFVEGDKIKIYTLVFNPAQKTLSGTVTFFDKTIILGKKEFSVKPASAETVFIDWTVTLGGHEIFARIDNPRFETSPGQYEEVYLANNETERSTRTVAKKLPDVSVVTDKISEAFDAGIKPIQNIDEKISNKLPKEISGPIQSTTAFLESNRTSGFDYFEKERVQLKSELDALYGVGESNPETQESEDKIDSLIQESNESKEKLTNTPYAPLRYVWLFILTVFSLIFKYKIVFYALLVLFIFLLIKFITRMVR